MEVKWKVKRGETTKIAKRRNSENNIVSDTARGIIAVFLITITFGLFVMKHKYKYKIMEMNVS